MTTERAVNITDIETRYPNEWVLVGNPVTDK